MRPPRHRPNAPITLEDIYDAIWALTDEIEEQKAQHREDVDTLTERMSLRDGAFTELEKRVSRLERQTRATDPCPPPETNAS